MKSRGKPLTKPEVANLLKSKNLGHVAYYIDSMIEDGTVVQVERMLYTTLDQAYSNIDLYDLTVAEIKIIETSE